MKSLKENAAKLVQPETFAHVDHSQSFEVQKHGLQLHAEVRQFLDACISGNVDEAARQEISAKVENFLSKLGIDVETEQETQSVEQEAA